MDIRGVRTKRAIEEGFVSLLREKAAARITVTEICKLSGINRATFYKHYLDIPDLHASMEEEILADFQRVFQHNSVSDSTKEC